MKANTTRLFSLILDYFVLGFRPWESLLPLHPHVFSPYQQIGCQIQLFIINARLRCSHKQSAGLCNVFPEEVGHIRCTDTR